MRVFYGGDPKTTTTGDIYGQGSIEMVLALMSDYMSEAVYTEDKTTYLFDHVGFRCVCWLNPGATSVTSASNPNPNGSPTLTATNLISILQQDRRVLIVTMDTDIVDDGDPTEVFIQSPYPGAVTDALFGPKCIVRDFNLNHGNGSIVLDLEFHTDIAPCGGVNANAKSVVLSNRWDYKVSYDEETFAQIRTISGEAIFRQDNLQAVLNGQCDLLRQFLVPPVPLGYERRAPVFEPSSDNNALRYVITDTQQARSVPQANSLGIADIQISEIREYLSGWGANIFSDFRTRVPVFGAAFGAPPTKH